MINRNRFYFNLVVQIFSLIIVVTIASSCTNVVNNTNDNKSSVSNINNENTANSNYVNAQTSGTESLEPEKMNGTLKVHYINVAQGDAILIQCDGVNMLIDAGANDKAELVKYYLESQGVNKLEYVIGTHPHEDHIGGIDVVIDNFDIGKAIMPKETSTTETFKDVINSINNKNLKITEPKVGTSYSLGGASWEIVAPNSNFYDNSNNYSVVIKLIYRNNSFLFTGDAEDISEEEMLNNGIDLKADVLKLGHHGSSSSTTEEFLAAVKPEYAVISVGRMNSYGHPHNEVMSRLDASAIPVYRTDESSTIVATSDGEKITFNCESGSYLARDNSENEISETDDVIPEYDISTDSSSGIEITSIDKVNEIVTIKNNSDEDINLEGWTLNSVTGNQKYVFEDYIIEAGDSITVASGKTEGDIKWSNAYIWNNKSDDDGILLDVNGKVISLFEN